MRKYAAAVFLAAFLQGVSQFLWWPALVVGWAAGKRDQSRDVYFLAFGGGLLTDLVSSKFLGVTAVYLLFLAAVIRFLKVRFEISTRALLVILVISQILWKLPFLPGF